MELAIFLAHKAEMHKDNTFTAIKGGIGNVHGTGGVGVSIDVYAVISIHSRPHEAGRHKVLLQLRDVASGATPVRGPGELKIGDIESTSYHVIPLKGPVPYGRYSAEVLVDDGKWSARFPFGVFRLDEASS